MPYSMTLHNGVVVESPFPPMEPAPLTLAQLDGAAKTLADWPQATTVRIYRSGGPTGWANVDLTRETIEQMRQELLSATPKG